VLLRKLMDRNALANLPFIIDRLREYLRVGKEGIGQPALTKCY
jgi:hypothetical protein